jgi:hypothetical protein
MKNIFSNIAVGLLILTSTTFAQTKPTGGPSGGPGDRPTRPNGPPVPSLVRDNDQIKVFAADFNTSRETFRARLLEMKKILQETPENQRTEQRAKIRQFLVDHRTAQNEFRKNIRRVTKEVREEKLGVESGTGG